MTPADPSPTSKRSFLLQNYLPAVFKEDEGRYTRNWEIEKKPVYDPPFLNDYLLPYEEILLKGDEDLDAIADRIDRIPELLDPKSTEERLLPWLGKFAAFAVRRDVPVERTREALRRLIFLYRIRGTKEYLETLLTLFIDARVTVVDGQPDFQINRYSTIGVNACIGGASPWYFRVYLRFSAVSAGHAEFQAKLARELVDLAKPAHTAYTLEVVLPRMQIGVRSTINLDSIL
jgi:phage tail-like protein